MQRRWINIGIYSLTHIHIKHEYLCAMDFSRWKTNGDQMRCSRKPFYSKALTIQSVPRHTHTVCYWRKGGEGERGRAGKTKRCAHTFCRLSQRKMCFFRDFFLSSQFFLLFVLSPATELIPSLLPSSIAIDYILLEDKSKINATTYFRIIIREHTGCEHNLNLYWLDACIGELWVEHPLTHTHTVR